MIQFELMMNRLDTLEALLKRMGIDERKINVDVAASNAGDQDK